MKSKVEYLQIVDIEEQIIDRLFSIHIGSHKIVLRVQYF